MSLRVARMLWDAPENRRIRRQETRDGGGTGGTVAVEQGRRRWTRGGVWQEMMRQPTDKSGATNGGWEMKDRGRGAGGQEAATWQELEASGISWEEGAVSKHERQSCPQGGRQGMKDRGGGVDFFIRFFPHAEKFILNNLTVTSLHISCFLNPSLYGTHIHPKNQNSWKTQDLCTKVRRFIFQFWTRINCAHKC